MGNLGVMTSATKGDPSDFGDHLSWPIPTSTSIDLSMQLGRSRAFFSCDQGFESKDWPREDITHNSVWMGPLASTNSVAFRKSSQFRDASVFYGSAVQFLKESAYFEMSIACHQCIWFLQQLPITLETARCCNLSLSEKRNASVSTNSAFIHSPPKGSMILSKNPLGVPRMKHIFFLECICSPCMANPCFPTIEDLAMSQVIGLRIPNVIILCLVSPQSSLGFNHHANDQLLQPAQTRIQHLYAVSTLTNHH